MQTNDLRYFYSINHYLAFYVQVIDFTLQKVLYKNNVHTINKWFFIHYTT